MTIASTTTHAVRVRDLRKSFGDHHVLRGVDLDIAPGSVFALLGPNGAGKTTIVRILSTLSAPDSGTVEVAGLDLARDARTVRRTISTTGQFSAVDGLLTGRENLDLVGRLHHLSTPERSARTDELLETFDLVGAADRRTSTYSGGMRRRLDLAMSLVARPSVLFLDEPTTGLDPTSRHALWDVVRGLADDGTTVVLTTQYLDEADRLADHIAVLHDGRIVAEGTSRELTSQVGDGHAELQLPDAAALARAATALPGSEPDATANRLRVPHVDDVASLRSLLARLEELDVEVDDLRLQRPDLDDVFRLLTQTKESA